MNHSLTKRLGNKLSTRIKMIRKFSLVQNLWVLLFTTFSIFGAAAADVFFRANQLGYRPRDEKGAIIFGEPVPPKFELVSRDTGRAVFSGSPRKIEGSWGSLQDFAELDF